MAGRHPAAEIDRLTELETTATGEVREIRGLGSLVEVGGHERDRGARRL